MERSSISLFWVGQLYPKRLIPPCHGPQKKNPRALSALLEKRMLSSFLVLYRGGLSGSTRSA